MSETGDEALVEAAGEPGKDTPTRRCGGRHPPFPPPSWSPRAAFSFADHSNSSACKDSIFLGIKSLPSLHSRSQGRGLGEDGRGEFTTSQSLGRPTGRFAVLPCLYFGILITDPLSQYTVRDEKAAASDFICQSEETNGSAAGVSSRAWRSV